MKRIAALPFTMLLALLPLTAEDSQAVFSYSVENYPEHKIIESLMAGHRSEIRYEIRVFKKVSGLRKILGDTLVYRAEIAYVARWDALNELFVVLVDDTLEMTFDSERPFLAFFLRLTDHQIALSEELIDGGYLLCRSRIQPVKLIPPLTLMTLIKTDLQTVSDWNRLPVVWYRR